MSDDIFNDLPDTKEERIKKAQEKKKREDFEKRLGIGKHKEEKKQGIIEKTIEQDRKDRELKMQLATMDDIMFFRNKRDLAARNDLTVTEIKVVYDIARREKRESDRQKEIESKINSLPEKNEKAGVTDDMSLARIVADELPHLRYIAKWRRWLIWDGKSWVDDEGGILARGLIMKELIKYAEGPNGLTDKEMIKVRSENRLTAIERVMRSFDEYHAEVGDWDQDDWLLNTQAGVVDLKTGKVKPHDPKYMMRKITKTEPKGVCPNWLAFIRRITEGDKDLADYIQRFFGYCLTGDTSLQKFAFLYGPGGNGKSTLVEVVSNVMGRYASTARSDILLESKGTDHPAGEAQLMGSRMVVTSELSTGKTWDEGRLKSLTGGDTISARFMRGNFFEFRPHFKLVIAGNNKPRMKSVDDGMIRRLQLLPLEVDIPVEERDYELKNKLLKEVNGILKWLIEGCVRYREHGLNEPESVKTATSEYIREEDIIEDFLATCCNPSPLTEGLTSGDFFPRWKKFCEERGEYPGSSKGLGRRLSKVKRLKWRMIDGHKRYTGYELKPAFDQPPSIDSVWP